MLINMNNPFIRCMCVCMYVREKVPFDRLVTWDGLDKCDMQIKKQTNRIKVLL